VQPLGGIFVKIDLSGLCDDFLVGVVAAGRADVVRALKLTAAGAFIRVRGGQGIVGPTHVPARLGDFILWDSHVTTSGQ
jgi:hypothetical protein